MISVINTKEWFPNLDNCISDGTIQSFRTQKIAIEEAKKFGWGKNIIRIDRRFERIYIIGTIDHCSEVKAGIDHQVLRVPMLKYDTDTNGTKYQPVVKFTRPSSSKSR